MNAVDHAEQASPDGGRRYATKGDCVKQSGSNEYWRSISKIWLVFCFSLLLLNACTPAKSPQKVEIGDTCIPAKPEQVFHEGLYQSERLGKMGEAYYSWTYIRFFEERHFEIDTTFEEKASSAAKIFLHAGAEDAYVTSGRYPVNGSIISMKTETSEYLGQIIGASVGLEFYFYKTRKSGKHEFTYHAVDAIWRDIINQPGQPHAALKP